MIPSVAFCEFQYGKWLAFYHFRHREDLSQLPAPGPDNLAGKGHAFGFQPFHRQLDVFDTHRHMMEHLIAKRMNPRRDNAGAASIIGVGLIHEERGISDFPIDLRVPIFIFDRFAVPIAEPREFLRPPVDVQRPQREMVRNRLEADPRFIQRGT